MSTRSAEEYRDDAHIIRVLAQQASGQDARSSLLGMAELCVYLSRRMDISRDKSHPTDQLQMPLSQPPSTPPLLASSS